MENIKIGDVLKVSRGSNFHYEKAIQILPEILTQDMPEEENSDISIQGLSENFKYEIIPDIKIVRALRYKAIKLTNDHCICYGDQYGMATNPKCLLHGNEQFTDEDIEDLEDHEIHDDINESRRIGEIE
jgi:hypothetical protein